MKSLRTRSGPFAEQPYYEPHEIDRICNEELRAVELYPSAPEPIRIERFIEKRFKLAVVYDDLPPGVLGYTSVGRKGVESVVVSRTLCDDRTAVAERRVSTTLAHEAGHGLLHGHLFMLDEPPASLFGAGSSADHGRILCRDDAVAVGSTGSVKRYDGRWWEFQANQAIGGLLLPKQLVERSVSRFLIVRGGLAQTVLPDDQREAAVRHVAHTFDVNPVVARIRLEGMYSGEKTRQMML